MLPLWTKLVLIIPAVMMSVEDFRNRRISVAVLAVFAVCVLSYEWLAESIVAMLINMATNIGLLAVMFGGVALSLLVRSKSRRKPIKELIGLGDVLFMVAATPLFPLKEFLYFMLVSFIAALLGWLAIRSAKRRQDLTIPLVGAMGSVLSIWIVISVIV